MDQLSKAYGYTGTIYCIDVYFLNLPRWEEYYFITVIAGDHFQNGELNINKYIPLGILNGFLNLPSLDSCL